MADDYVPSFMRKESVEKSDDDYTPSFMSAKDPVLPSEFTESDDNNYSFDGKGPIDNTPAFQKKAEKMLKENAYETVELQEPAKDEIIPKKGAAPEIDESLLSEADKRVLSDTLKLQESIDYKTPTDKLIEESTNRPLYDAKAFFKILPKDVQNNMVAIKANEIQSGNGVPVIVTQSDVESLSEEDFYALEKKAWDKKEQKRLANYRKTLKGTFDPAMKGLKAGIKEFDKAIDHAVHEGSATTLQLASNIAQLGDDYLKWGAEKLATVDSWITGRPKDEIMAAFKNNPTYMKNISDDLALRAIKNSVYAQQNTPKTVIGKTISGITKATYFDVPTYVTAGRLFGPTWGMGAVEYGRNMHHGKKTAMWEGAKGMAFGKLLDTYKYLPGTQKSLFMGATGSSVAYLEGANVDDIAASGFTMFTLGAIHSQSRDPLMPKSPMAMHNPIFDHYKQQAQLLFNRARDANLLAPLNKVKITKDAKFSIGDFYHTVGEVRLSPNYEKYYAERGVALGKKGRLEDLGNKIWKDTKKYPVETLEKMTTILNGEPKWKLMDGVSKEKYIKSLPKEARDYLNTIRKEFQELGAAGVRNGRMSQETYDKHKGEYLPAEYMQYLLPEATLKSIRSKFSHLKQANLKHDYSPNAMIYKEVLGQIRHAGYLASRGLARQGAIVAKDEFLDRISPFNDIMMPQSQINYRGKNWGLKALQEHRNTFAERLVDAKGDTAKHIKAEIKLIDQAIKMQDTAFTEVKLNSKEMKKWVELPNTPEWGRHGGKYIRKEIYNDIKNEFQPMPPEAGIAERIFGGNGWIERATRVWKTAKVPLNPPSQVRNFISNAFLFQLSGEQFSEMPKLLMEAAKEIRTGGHFWKIAKKYGIKESGFTAAEAYKIERAFVEYIAQQKGTLFSTQNMIGMGSKFLDAIRTKGVKEVGSYYQYNEALFKTAKIIAEMRRGKTEVQAVKSAQDALFDYGHVPASIKFMRKKGIAPFITYFYKSAPRMLETAVVNPQRFLPYILAVEAMKESAKSAFNWTDEDFNAYKNSLSGWMKDKGHVMILPYKDEHGRLVPFDFSYFVPWGAFAEMYNSAVKGNLTNFLNTAGLMTGPLMDITAAIKTNIDPFTGREIVDKNAPGKEQMWQLANYVLSLSAPTWVTDRGFAGKMLEAINKEVDPRTGEPGVTKGQAALRAFGMNTYATDPRAQRVRNIRKMRGEINDVKKELRKTARNHNYINKPKEREDRMNHYRELLKRKIDELQKYVRDSELPDY